MMVEGKKISLGGLEARYLYLKLSVEFPILHHHHHYHHDAVIIAIELVRVPYSIGNAYIALTPGEGSLVPMLSRYSIGIFHETRIGQGLSFLDLRQVGNRKGHRSSMKMPVVR
jgi:hypothetical protein